MLRLSGMHGVRALVLLAAVALMLSTGCWAGAYMTSYGNGEDNGGSMLSGEPGSASGWKATYSRGKSQAVAPYDDEQGIRVRATGSATGVPDLAIVSLGVESIEDTASEARASAAEAMAGVMQVLEEAEIAERDIQTRHFNISPRYQSVRVTQCPDEEEQWEGGLENVERMEGQENCITFWEQKLVGYTVSNQVSVNIRDLERAGTIIDRVTDAAGDLVRVNGIRFTIEDAESLQDEARSRAVAEMQRKAEQMADLSGVGLGRLVNLQEETFYYEPEPVFARSAGFAAESAADTSISAGELEVTVSVAGTYLIVEPAADE